MRTFIRDEEMQSWLNLFPLIFISSVAILFPVADPWRISAFSRLPTSWHILTLTPGPGDSIETERVEIGSNNLEWILKPKYDTERVGIRRDLCQLQDICWLLAALFYFYDPLSFFFLLSDSGHDLGRSEKLLWTVGKVISISFRIKLESR